MNLGHVVVQFIGFFKENIPCMHPPPPTLGVKSIFQLGFVFKKLIVAFYLHQQNHLCHIMVICDHDNQEGTSCTFTFNT